MSLIHVGIKGKHHGTNGLIESVITTILIHNGHSWFRFCLSTVNVLREHDHLRLSDNISFVFHTLLKENMLNANKELLKGI